MMMDVRLPLVGAGGFPTRADGARNVLLFVLTLLTGVRVIEKICKYVAVQFTVFGGNCKDRKAGMHR